MQRVVRCQAVIIKNDCILVLTQYNRQRKNEYWMLPGGGLEEGESEKDCIRREIREETNLEVEIKCLLFDEPGTQNCDYKRYVTFLCVPLEDSFGAAGKETNGNRQILDLVWCSISDEAKWNKFLLEPHFHPSMERIKQKLKDLGVIN